MRYMLLHILCGLVFTQTLRYSQRRRARDYVAGAVNYVLAAAVSLAVLAVLAARRPLPSLWPSAALGAACGASYFGQFLLILLGYRLAGVGITMAVAAMGIVVPILLSWLWWSEAMTLWRWTALALLPVAMVLLRPLRRRLRHLSVRADAVLAGLFLNAGLMGTLHKAVNVYAPGGGAGDLFLFFRPHQLLYQACLFAAAAVSSVAYAVRRRGRCGRAELALGSVAGSVNVLGTISAVVGLGLVAAAVFLPTVTCASIALSVIVSRILWGERVTPRQIAGVLAAGLIVVLANL